MSLRYKGGRISATPPTTTGGESGVASGSWTLEQQLQAQGAGNWPEPFVAKYIEDVFSTYLYTGTGASQTITNGIDLAGKGGMVWLKARTSGGSSFTNHAIIDTARGANANGYYSIYPNLTEAQFSPTGSGDAIATAVSSTGFTVGGNANVNYNTQTDVSWTFRKQPKFFDVVTYTGNGVNGRAISHNLGSTPGFIVVKCTSAASQWTCWHRAYNSGNGYGYLNDTTAWFNTGADVWGNGTTYTAPTSTTFTVNAASGLVNDSSATYVAYLFAHNAGGFGLTGTDNVISCGSYIGNGVTTGPTVTLGYEPQLLIVKKASDTADWLIYDNMRNAGSWGTRLNPNLSNAENSNIYAQFEITATGFYSNSANNSSNSSTNTSGATYIYIAIRRGPMKVPTSGTSVFSPNRWTSTVGSAITTNFPLDLQISKWMGVGGDSNFVQDRLRGLNTVTTNSAQPYLLTESTAAEGTNSGANYNFGNTGFLVGDNDSANGWAINFRRAPSFFDEVCYTGTGAGDNPRTFTHNLQVVPELMIIKRRNSTAPWIVYSASQGASKYATLNTTDAFSTADEYLFNNTSPTASVFTVGSPNGANASVNASGGTYVAYLFATCAGVSKVGSYTGTGTTLQVNCGFTGGARFVLIKRTDSTGDWYVWDSARGIVAGNDPYLLLNSTAAEVTNTDYVDTYSAGFEISSTAPAAINASGGTYIFLAIA